MITLYGFGRIFPEGRGETKDLWAQWALEETGLAYRLHALKKDVEIGWPALYAQFGGGYGAIRFFRRHFIECLALAMAAYPEARISLSERGVILMPSRPPIAKAS